MLNEAQVIKMNHTKQVKKQQGAAMIEYALVVAVVVAIGGAFFSGTDSGIGLAISEKIDAIVLAIS